MYEIRKIEWKHGHLSVYALHSFSYSKNHPIELKFFAHLSKMSLVGKHKRTGVFKKILTLVVVGFHNGTQVGHEK